MTVLISTINYNSSKYTIKLIDSIVRSGMDGFSLVVADNASSDAELSILAEYFSMYSSLDVTLNTTHDSRISAISTACMPNGTVIYLLSLNDNYGFACANNIVYEFGETLCKIQYFWMLNNDAYVEKNTLNALLVYSLKKDDNAVLSSKVLSLNGDVWFEGGIYNKYLATASHVSYDKFLSSSYSYLSGCSMFVPRQIIEKVGLLNSSIFLYAEDLEYSMRLSSHGILIDIVRDSIVWHVSGASSKPRSCMAYYHNSRNTISVIVNKYGYKMYSFILPYHLLKILFLFIFKSVPVSSLKGYLLGILHTFSNHKIKARC